VILWITSKLHGIDSTVIALVGISGVAGDWRPCVAGHHKRTHAWEVFIWYGGLGDDGDRFRRDEHPNSFRRGDRFADHGLELACRASLSLRSFIFYAHYAFASITAPVTAMFIPFLALR
jgi:DASS family divalent anion:Na+ symporter